jgi:hypothetical protein
MKPIWKVVESTPPPDYTPVLAYMCGHLVVAYRHYDDSDETFTWRQLTQGGGWENMRGCHIQYWMHLPDIPYRCGGI